MPVLSFSTDGLLGGPDTIDQVEQAFFVGCGHIDTAPSRSNEAAVGVALRESGLSGEDVHITTKYTHTGSNSLNIEASTRNSLHDVSTYPLILPQSSLSVPLAASHQVH